LYRHTLAHCRPRSCGRQRAKPTRKTKRYAKSNRTRTEKKSLASQKLNIFRHLIGDREKTTIKWAGVTSESTVDSYLERKPQAVIE